VAMWEERLGAQVDQMEPMSAAMVELGRSLTAMQLIEAVDVLARWSRRIAASTSSTDVLLTPTMAVVPPELGILAGDNPNPETGTLSAMVSFAIPFDVSGQPAISLPLAWTPEGLPIGVQLAAPYGREDVLFRLASQIEIAQPWTDRHPASATAL
jgi:amidase